MSEEPKDTSDLPDREIKEDQATFADGAAADGKTEEEKTAEEKAAEEKAVKDRWWVDFGDKDKDKAPPAPVVAPAPPVGQKFYRAAKGFEQESARARLTDLNQKLLVDANPDVGQWGYVNLAERPFSVKEADRIRHTVDLPAYARGAFIDSGRTVRILVTGTPIGERILELALTREPSFDCWIQGEWVKEELFKDRKRALRAFREYIERYLSPEGIATWESDRARA